MDQHPPFDHQHYRRAHTGQHYPDQPRHYADQHLGGGIGGRAALARCRYDYDPHPIQYLPSDHQLPRIHHQPPAPPPPPPPPLPPPPPPHLRHDTPHYAPLPLRAPPETYSPPPYRSLSPRHPYHPQHHGGEDFRAADEIRHLSSRRHQDHQMPGPHNYHQPQLTWETVEEERRHYAPLQLRLSPPDSRKRPRCGLHEAGDLESTSSSGPPPRRQRRHQHSSYSSDEDFVDRAASHPSYGRHEGFEMHGDSKGNRKMQTSGLTMLPDSPHRINAGYMRRDPQNSTPARLSVWQRIEENPSVYTPSSPRQLPKKVPISPAKAKNAGYASKELASIVFLDCKAVSPPKTTKSSGSASKELASVISVDHKAARVDCKSNGDNSVTKKSTGKKSEKALASVLVRPAPQSKEKKMAVKQATRKLDKVQNSVPGFSNGTAGLIARPGTGVKKKIVIKKIVRKINASDKQTIRSIVPEQKDGGDANADACEKEEGEITTSSVDKDDSLISTSDTAGVGSSVADEREQNDSSMNPCKSNTAAIESASVLDTESVRSQHPEKEDGEFFMNPGDVNANSVVDSTKVLDAIGSEHPGDRGCMDLVSQNSGQLCENEASQMKEDDMAVPGAVDCNCPRISDTVKLHGYDVPEAIMGNNTACVNGVKGDTKQIWESMNPFTNNSFRSPSTDEASVTACKGGHRKKCCKVCVGSLGNTIGTPNIAEPSMTQDIHKEEGNMLNNSKDKGIVSDSSQGALDSMELSVNEDIQDKDGRIPMELGKAVTSMSHHFNARDGLEASVNEDIKDKECIASIELQGAATSVTHHEKAHNAMESGMNEDIHKIERQMSIDSNALKTTQHIEGPLGSEVCRSHVDSEETHVDTAYNSIDPPDFILAGATGDLRTQELLHDQRIALDKSNEHWVDMEGSSNFPLSKNVESLIMLLDSAPIKDSSGSIILNNDAGKDSTSQAAVTMHIHRADLSPANNLSLLHSCDSSSVFDNNEHSLPTALTLGNTTYSSSAEGKHPEKNYKLMESSKGLGDLTATKLCGIEKGQNESSDDSIKADAQNWLTLPLSINYANDDATVGMGKFHLEHNVDEGTYVNQDNGNTLDMDQYRSMDALDGQEHSLQLSCSDASQSDLLTLKERNKDIENESEIVLPESSVCSVNVLEQYDYHTTDKPIDSTNKHIILSAQSAGVTGVELASSQVVDPGHAYDSNTMDPMVESSTKPDSLSSWMEATVSEARKEHKPCKSTPDMFLGPKEDDRKTLPDPLLNCALKSSPRMNTASSTVPNVPTKQVALPSSSRETLRQNPNARHKTWHRDSVLSCKSYLRHPQPSGLPLPPKVPLKKDGKTQNAYIRKGNALIRNPATGNHPLSSSGLDAPFKLTQPIMRRSMNFVRKVDSNDTVVHSKISVERPKTPPLPLHTKSISTNISESLTHSLQKQQVPETEKKDSSGQINSGVAKPGVSSLQKSEPLNAGKMIYVRPKSNQLVASPGQQSGDSSGGPTNKVPLLQPSTASDLYVKKRKNQIVLGSSTSDVLSSKEASQTENSNTGETKAIMLASSNKNLAVAKDRPHKANQATNTVGSFSHVWTLSGQQPQRKSFVRKNHLKAFPRILPWKRKLFSYNYRSNHSPVSNTSSLGIVRKLLKTRKRSAIYTVSTDGFSLRKSGLLSVDGSSLKWSRFLEKGSWKVDEEATLAVTEPDRKKRDRRKSIRNKGRNDQYSLPVAARNNNHTSPDCRVPATCNEYVRVNKGNQLVRNPKKVIRMLASEKVRWSLHTVRSRLAKKQQYCQFFTRFGECKKSGGKCPYIHDRAKVAICTKFLKGLCSNASCKLTHKVLPERMPDCSYFLQALCSNTTCPYRHVKVNTNAPICEDFLKGYCAHGDECRKKHSYVCPVFEATGECPQQSRCKLHHPKKKIKSKRSTIDTLQNNSWGRYFDSSVGGGSEAMRICSEEDKEKPEHATGGDLTDFIDLGPDIDSSLDMNASDDIHLMELDSRNLKMQADNLDALIKPLRIMRTARV